MKEKDFDEIGKRLYDHEADPPKKGWDKIATILNAPPKPGKVVWLRKNWWKPLVLIVPLAFYTLYSVQNDDALKSDRSSPADSVVKESPQPKAGVQPTDKAMAKPSIDANVPRTTGQEKLKSQDESKKANTRSTQKESSDREAPLSRHIIGDESGEDRSSSQNNESLSRKHAEISGIGTENRGSISEDENEKDPPRAEQLNDNSTLIATAAEAKDSERESEQNESGIIKGQVAVLYDDTNAVVNPGGNNNQAENQEIVPSADTGETQIAIERTDSISTENMLTEADIEKDQAEEEQRDKKLRTWRLVASFSPLYLTSKTEPVFDDDVLITKVKNSNPERIGYDISVGAGRSFAPNLYIDGLLSFMRTEQNTFYAYSTGEVDTLIATQLPDQSVQVSPVYRVNNAEVLGKYSYGGMKLGATYYFWDNKRRRFNLAATLGAYYLIDSDVKEKVNNRWITLDNKSLAKMNYSFTIGAGYNRYLYPGWELMINPVLTHYTGKSRFEQLPYRQTQRSLGVNFMLSKTLEKKN